MLVVMGIDVSKATLDAALYFPTTEKIRGHHKVSNDAEGIATLKTWSIQHAGGIAADVRVIIEATNTYHELATELLHAAGCTVVVANVKRVKRFRESMTHNKTDPADARTLALFGAMPCRQRHAWQPPPNLIASLRCLLRRLGAVNRDTHRELSRYKSLRKERAPQPVLDSFARMLVTHTQERRQLLADIRAHYRAYPALAEQIKLMRTMPAMGELSSLFLACVIFSRTFRSARQLTAFLALTPVHTKSGESVEAPARLSGEGDRYVRAALYMAALCAIRINKRTAAAGNPAMRAVYDRLRATRPKQLRPKQCLIGVVRHMVSSEYGMLLHQLPFNPRLVSCVTLDQRREILGASETHNRHALPSIDSAPVAAQVAPSFAQAVAVVRPRVRRTIRKLRAGRLRA